MARVLLCSMLLATSAAWAGDQVVWQIGKPDHDYAEFASPANYAEVAKRFTKPIVFEVGRSNPAKDWPFIQAGPIDAWSPQAGKPWTIRFTLPEEPQGVYLLRIEFTDVQAAFPPRYQVTIGSRCGQLQLGPGGGDASLTNAKAGKPQKIEMVLPAAYFRKGANQIELACVEGCWVQYDAITLLNDPQGKLPDPQIQSLSVKATPFFIRSAGKVLREVDVAVALNVPAAEVSLRVEAGGQTIDVPVRQLPHFGGVSQEIGVPDSKEPMDVKVTATAGKSTRATTVKILPQRKWRVYVAPSSHTDIGYTDIQSKCAERHCENLDTALKLLREFPDFRWNLEVAWQAENYLATRKGPQREAFLRAARENKVGVQALYCNILTGLCSHEEACRLTALGAKLSRQYKIPYGSAMISDVPTQEASLPMLLAGSGIRYFSSGINNDRAYTFTQMQGKSPCWWEGPDGSRVLMMYVAGYAHASGWGLDQSVDVARARVLGGLQSYADRKDYPYDAVFLHGAVGDNVSLNAKLAEVCKAWNDRYEFPKLSLSPNADFFEYIEKHYGDKLPVFRGSAGTYWEDGAGSSARETRWVRNAHEQVATGEKFLALAERIGGTKRSRPEAIYDVWRNCMLYDEHTWGAYCSISQPESEFTKAQWKIKAQFAVDAEKGARAVQDQGTKALASLVNTDGPAKIFLNPTSWPRTDVAMQITADAPFGKAMVVKDVPPCGYRVLKPEVERVRVVGQLAEGTAIESRYYRVEFDPATGGIKSIRDKELGKELVDPKAPYGANQYVYVAGGNDTRIVANPDGPVPKLTLSTSGKATLRRIRYPGAGETMTVETSGSKAPRISSVVSVWDDMKWVEIANFLTKDLTYEKEGVYFAFPFAVDKPTFRYECPAGIVNANRDMLPGACLDWFTVQHFVEIEGKDVAIAWATPDAPLVCFQDVNRGKWQNKLDFNTGHLYAYVMNNYWHTNYLAGQGGPHSFRFAITSRAKSDRAASARFGFEVSNRLLNSIVSANPDGKLPAKPTSLMSLAEPNVIVIGTKLSETGPGLVVRLWEVEGKPTTAHLRLDPRIPARKATACNLVEVPGESLEVRDGTVSVPIRGAGLATVRIE
jgi:hypothetical protein